MKTFTAFHGDQQIPGGLEGARSWVEAHGEAGLLCFEDQTGRQVDFNWREPEKPQAGPGRPKLGVVSREISLLPRHWSGWRRSRMEHRRRSGGWWTRVWAMPGETERRRRRRRDGLTAMAGNLPGYEEATRALYAGDLEKLVSLMAGWPADIGEYAARLAEGGPVPFSAT